MSAGNAGPVRLIVTLVVAGLISGSALVSIYLVTKPLIEQNQAEALQRAIFHVLKGATRAEAFVRNGATLVAAPPKTKEPQVYAGFDDQNRFVGWAIPWSGNGFQDVIKLIYGYAPGRQRIIGMEVLDSRETPGLGDKIIKDQKFVAQFLDLAVAPQIEAIKSSPAKPNQLMSISGATISSKAVVRIVNSGNSEWLAVLKGEPPVKGAEQ